MEGVLIAFVFFFLYKLYGFFLFLSISRATPDKRLKSFLKVLGNKYSSKDDLLGTKYKWYKYGAVITAVFDDQGELVEKNINAYNFSSFRNRISFSRDV